MPKSIKGINNNNNDNSSTLLHIYKKHLKKPCFIIQNNILKNRFEERTREANVYKYTTILSFK